jgi:hypothetical protein
MLNIGPVTLEGKTVLLRPPSSDDLNELILSASEGKFGIILSLFFLV